MNKKHLRWVSSICVAFFLAQALDATQDRISADDQPPRRAPTVASDTEPSQASDATCATQDAHPPGRVSPAAQSVRAFPVLLDMGTQVITDAWDFVQQGPNSFTRIYEGRQTCFLNMGSCVGFGSRLPKDDRELYQFILVYKNDINLSCVESAIDRLRKKGLEKDNQLKIVAFSSFINGDKPKAAAYISNIYTKIDKRNIVSFFMRYFLWERPQARFGFSIDFSHELTKEYITNLCDVAFVKWDGRFDGIDKGVFKDEKDALENIRKDRSIKRRLLGPVSRIFTGAARRLTLRAPTQDQSLHSTQHTAALVGHASPALPATQSQDTHSSTREHDAAAPPVSSSQAGVEVKLCA